jgi:large subunit ribosomal protein L25
MAKEVKLKAEPRSATGRSAARRLKAQGIIPAVIYGAKVKPQPLQVSARDINAMLSHASGENILVELEIQHSPLGGNVLHVDFHAVSMDETIHAEVPLESVGVPNGVKNFGGLLEQSLRALAVECLPRDLPDKITVDVSNLNIGDSIHVRDIPLPKGVTAKAQPELTAFSVLAPAVEEEPVVAATEAEAAAAGPEVIKEKKVEGETATPAAGAASKGAAPKGAAPKEKEQKK